MSRRILIFSTAYFPMVGGAEVALREITDRLPSWQFDLICARIRPGLPATEKIGNVTVHRCGLGHPVDKYLLPLLGAIRALMLVRANEVVCIWSMLASYNGFAALVYSWLRPKTKFLLTLQEGDPLEHYAKRTGKLTFLHQRIFRRADRVQAISKFLADWSRRMGFRGQPDIIPNGVDLERFQPQWSVDERQRRRQELGFAADDTVLVTASRLSLKNGVDDLIRSLHFLSADAKALILGDGEDRKKLEVLCEQKGLQARVVFLGQQSHEALPGLLELGDIFIRPSLSEGLGNAFLEAMALGLPIIGTPVGGIPDFLTDGQTGLFCQPHDPESIAAAVKRLQTEADLRANIIKQGYAVAHERYDWAGVATAIERVLQSFVITTET